jgi:hypothetical protein
MHGSVRRTPTGGPTTADGARYLEELRAQWRSRPKGGLRLFNPDETPAERDERIREAQALLESLRSTTPDEGREPTEEERLEALFHDEMIVRLNRDYTMSVVPPDFLLHEPPSLREERIRRTREGLAELRTGTPKEHRETLEALLAALDDDSRSPHEAREARSSV